MNDSVFESLVDAAGVGSEAAWTELVSTLDPQLRRFVASQRVSDLDAVVGETWLHVARSMHSFQGSYPEFRAWLYTIARNRIIDARRTASRRPVSPLDRGSGDEADLLTVHHAEPSAEEQALPRFTREQLDQVLEALTEDQRDVISLRFVAGFSLVEVADIMGKRVGSVQSLQRRAFKQLRRLLQEDVSLKEGLL